MTRKQVGAASDADTDYSTTDMPCSLFDEASTDCERQSICQTPLHPSVPCPGSKYFIRSVSTKKVVIFKHRKITLAEQSENGANCWQCVENNGWFGFQDPASSKLLGYDNKEELCLSAKKQNLWENFCVRQRPEGDYFLLMSHYDSFFTIAWQELRPVGIKTENGSEKLVIVADWQDKTTAWEFLEVPRVGA